MKTHFYKTFLNWTGNKGQGTKDYRAYDREYVISINNKPDLTGSADPAFRGDASRHNPEELFLASLSACHMLWYLHLCADEGIVVQSYEDHAEGTMETTKDGSGRFTNVLLKPAVKIEDPSQKQLALSLHDPANKMCFIANSCNFPVKHDPVIDV